MDPGSLHRLAAVRNDGREEPLSAYAGKVLLVVNTASRCGFTPQYRGLQALQDRFGARGFSVLGFPCDQFAHQEPGDDAEIAAFCSREFGVTFPLFRKIEVNGPGTHPVFAYLEAAAPGLLGRRVRWNFTKFLVDREGRAVARFAPATSPERLAARIERLLGRPA